jgi:hypothetical protein
LLRKWVLDAVAHRRLGAAIADYAAGEINLGEAAVRADVSVAHLLAELESRGIDTISPAHFRSSLTTLIDLFGGSDALRTTLTKAEG